MDEAAVGSGPDGTCDRGHDVCGERFEAPGDEWDYPHPAPSGVSTRPFHRRPTFGILLLRTRLPSCSAGVAQTGRAIPS